MPCRERPGAHRRVSPQRGINVTQIDMEKGLAAFENSFFNHAVMSHSHVSGTEEEGGKLKLRI